MHDSQNEIDEVKLKVSISDSIYYDERDNLEVSACVSQTTRAEIIGQQVVWASPALQHTHTDAMMD